MGISRKHFHSFDALRFFSFFLVFLQHVTTQNSSFASYFGKSGGIGVSFFFVLSGFLITYILLFEKTTKYGISLKNFFVRRILRIWPLFYAMLFFAFATPYLLDLLKLTSSKEGYDPNWLISLSFLENYKMMFTGSFPNTSPLRVMWSLCIEEHFYIIWGLTFYFISTKFVPHLIISSILLANILRIIYMHFGIASLDLFSNIDYFAFGAIPAYLLLFRSEIMVKVEKIPLINKYLVLIFTLVLIFIIPNLNQSWLVFVSPSVFGVLFSTIILFTLTSRKAIVIKDDYLISRLGIYTYGLYLFHTIIINFLLQIRTLLPFNLNWFVFAITSLLLTVMFSIASYYLFEKQFLKLKKYFYKW
jgi:peptidoglycan/LPS O-acetylase OafA/YrhL